VRAAVDLTPLPEERFPAFRAHIAKHYARDKVESGAWPAEEASHRAEADLDGLLPDGTKTTDHFFYAVRDAETSEEVGTLWLAIRNPGSGRLVWIYDVEIYDRFRRRGYATGTLEAAERKAKEMGLEKMELHVFGHNAAARALYEGQGYTPTSLVLTKQL
jgi:RimJ/RimL family protein N-acetyltransferase